jgi:DNA-binding XRE family transcriptional regulator
VQRYEVRYEPQLEDWRALSSAIDGSGSGVAFPWVVWDRVETCEEARCVTRRAAQRTAHELNVSAGWKAGYRLQSLEERSPWATALRTYREETGRTQEACAQEIGCSLSAWVKWEQGTRRPSSHVRKALTRLLEAGGADVPGLVRTSTTDEEEDPDEPES